MVSQNTSFRVISAAVLISVLMLCFYLGTFSTHIFIFIAGLLIVFEIYQNFLKQNAMGLNAIISYTLFSALFWFSNSDLSGENFKNTVLGIGLLVDVVFIAYLFFSSMESISFKDVWMKIPILLPFKLSIFITCIGFLINLPNWKILVGLVLFVNFGMDTGAWLIGKNFGKHKLWKTVSPSKTLEGLFGGVFFSALLGSLYWHFFLNSFNWALPLIFGGLGVFSQVGDLVQSKVKRQFSIKDSSALIPGHGGVYDRVDSLMFVTPMFLVLFKYFYFN